MASDLGTWLYNRVVVGSIGTVLPTNWFGPSPPATDTLKSADQPPKLEIVSHCWRYAHLLAYQLNSIVTHTPADLHLTYTLYYSESDKDTCALIEYYNAVSLPQVTWNWCSISEPELKRRAIGRNKSAQATQANWIWFADCDLIFHHNCLASLAGKLQGAKLRLAFPASEQITALLPASHPLVNVNPNTHPQPEIDPDDFSTGEITKAKGAFQIVHGDVARRCGYCPNLKIYQEPTEHWRKTFEDTAFRKLIQDQGTAVAIEGLHRIRHQSKGRYSQKGMLSRLRAWIRVIRGQ